MYSKVLTVLDKQKNDYSKQSAALVSEAKELMKDGIDAYHRASESIFGWCDEAISLLSAYVELFNDPTAEKSSTRKDLLIQVLETGATEMKAAQDTIFQSVHTFNRASGKLSTLDSKLAFQFEQNGETGAFFVDLKSIVDHSIRDMDETKKTLIAEIKETKELDQKTQEFRSFVDVDELPELQEHFVRAALNLIDYFKDYRRTHIQF